MSLTIRWLRLGKRTRRGVGRLSNSIVPSLITLLLSVAGCLERPIGISKPVTTNVVVQKQANNAITGIDLLIMIDNSSSMADKQQTLADAVPQLLGQLVKPQCVDADGKPFDPPISAVLGASPPCTQGSPEFNPVNNIHIGIVTSSLGGHGDSTMCVKDGPTDYSSILQPADVNDQSHLMGTLDRGKAALAADTNAQATALASMNDQGFLAWGNDLQPSPGDPDLQAARYMFRDMVKAAAEKGCGLEAQLESWFRFLIDPVPPILPLQPPDKDGHTARRGVDDALLLQRAQFLRPDSLVAILMLTDENDCSLRDTDFGWVAASRDASITTGSAPCAKNPNDPCCYSCTALDPPNGCQWSCPNPQKSAQPVDIDDGSLQTNIRCWQQKRRFGYEFTYPTSRYSVALTKKELCPDQTFGDMDCDCTYANSIGAGCQPGSRRFPNPLYSTIVGRKNDGATDVIGYPDAIARTDNSAVFLAGIVGVPWQDISETDSQAAGATLRYIPVTDPRWTTSGGIWDQIYADYNDHGKLPGDVRMVESIRPRSPLPAPTAGALADPINGHEWNTALGDLEYACIYKLPTPKPCSCALDDGACRYTNPNDCCLLNFPADYEQGPAGDFDKPLCQDPQTGAYDARTQYFAKGYPGLRELAVLHDYALSSGAGVVQGNSIVASICPKDLDPTTDTSSPGYGYNPAVAALINRLKVLLKGSCLPRPLTPDADGRVPCYVVEAVSSSKTGTQGCDAYCKQMGRNQEITDSSPSGGPSSKLQSAVLDSMRQSKLCDSGNGTPACNSMCLCLLSQESNAKNTTGNAAGSDLGVCQNVQGGDENGLPPGYCYVDPALLDGDGNPLAGNNPAIVAKCPDTQRRVLRFVGNDPSGGGAGIHVPVPLPNSFVFTACQGSAIAANSQ